MKIRVKIDGKNISNVRYADDSHLTGRKQQSLETVSENAKQVSSRTLQLNIQSPAVPTSVLDFVIGTTYS